MHDADLELLLYRILVGKLFFYYQNELYELRCASPLIRYKAQLLYNNIINDEKYNEWIREDQLNYLLINTNLWSKDTQKIMTSLEKQIEKTKIDLYLSANLKDKAKKIRNHLNNLRYNLSSIVSKKNDMFAHTLEGYASSIKNEYILCNTIFKNNQKVFNFSNNNQSSYLIFNDLVHEVNNQNISIESFKKLARSHLWKSYWYCDKNNLFGNSVKDWTDDQRTLVSMSIMYDNVYEHPDCPSDSIIEDDDMLDGWTLYQKQQNDKIKKQNQIDNNNPKLKNAQEVFLMAETAEDIEDITNLNSIQNINIIKQRNKYIQEFGATEESQLPDVKMKLMNQLHSAKNRK